jgi:hypothetical protein
MTYESRGSIFFTKRQHVVPAQAGTPVQLRAMVCAADTHASLVSRLRGNDVLRAGRLLLAACAAALPVATHAADDLNVLPYRPSVSTPAQLPVPGQLEFELGGLSSGEPDGHRASLPYTFKLAFNRDWGVLVEGDAFVSAHTENGRVRGIGDTSLVLKRAFIVDDATAFGLELAARLPTARDGIGSGKTDWTANAIYSQDFGKLHLDLNLNETRLGAPDPGASRMQAGASAAFSHEVGERWTATAEWSGTHNPGAPSTAQVLAALSYAPSKNLVVDVGFTHGLNPGSPRWSFFAGFVAPLARLW